MVGKITSSRNKDVLSSVARREQPSSQKAGVPGCQRVQIQNCCRRALSISHVSIRRADARWNDPVVACSQSLNQYFLPPHCLGCETHAFGIGVRSLSSEVAHVSEPMPAMKTVEDNATHRKFDPLGTEIRGRVLDHKAPWQLKLTLLM